MRLLILVGMVFLSVGCGSSSSNNSDGPALPALNTGEKPRVGQEVDTTLFLSLSPGSLFLHQSAGKSVPLSEYVPGDLSQRSVLFQWKSDGAGGSTTWQSLGTPKCESQYHTCLWMHTIGKVQLGAKIFLQLRITDANGQVLLDLVNAKGVGVQIYDAGDPQGSWFAGAVAHPDGDWVGR